MSNKAKSIHGVLAKNSLDYILNELKDKDCIKHIKEKIEKDKDIPYSLYAKRIITLPNDETWALYVTTSFRSDRVKGTHWDSLLLKKFSLADKCWLIFFSNISDEDRHKIDKEQEKIDNIKRSSHAMNELDGILYDIELYTNITKIAMDCLPHGRKEDKAGRSFEERIASIINYPDNLKIWNSTDNNVLGNQYLIFYQILHKLNLQKPIIDISATTDIPKLPSGGNPKTDVAITVTYNDNTTDLFTISCKNSRSGNVTCHEYAADKFIQALSLDDITAGLVQDFQEAGSAKKLGTEKSYELKQRLSPYVDKLCRWVLSGEYGECSQPEIQCAQYIYSYDSERFIGLLYSVDEYIEKLKSHAKDNPSSFGTPFSWTYPSKRLGKRIQLKMSTLNKDM